MDIRALEVFSKIVELRSFSKAAEAVHLTQPTVSGHIKALEEELDVKLFDRLGKAVVPTKVGELLYSYAKRILDLRKEAVQALAEHLGALKGELVIGASNNPGSYVLPPLLARFKAGHPGVSVTLKVGDSQEIARGIASGIYELGAVGAKWDDDRLRCEKFVEDELYLVVPPKHPWANRSSVQLKELLNEPFIMREQGSGSRKIMEQALQVKGIDPARLRVVAELGSAEAVRQAVQAGAGIAFLSRWAIQHDLECGLLKSVPVKDLSLKRDFYLIVHRLRSLSPLGKAFLAFLLQRAPVPR